MDPIRLLQPLFLELNLWRSAVPDFQAQDFFLKKTIIVC